MEKEFSRFDNQRLIENREMRFFLSSTFTDLDEERSALLRIFELLKVEAGRRGVSLSLVDLRWGITDEEARSGKVLSVCLEEIENSHPFFIGILGNRYGTSPDVSILEKNPELEERYPWIHKDIENGLSITEMEIQYGILRNPFDVSAAFFFKNIPGTPSDDNNKLTLLKDQIKGQNRFLKEDYTSIEDLCSKVESAVRGILDNNFPMEKFISEHAEQRAYITTQHSAYQRLQADFDRLDSFLKNNETHLVIHGASGTGKTALIANWLKEKEKYKEDLPYNIIFHFVGNSFIGNDYKHILQHICDEISQIYKLEREESSNGIENEAQHLLIEAGQKGKPLLIVIDGINQIKDQNYSKLLNWLPQAPQTTKYLFTTLEDDETMATFKRLKYKQHHIGSLDRSQRQQFIIDYLHNVGKKLNPDQIKRILVKSENMNMLVLKSLLGELICFGSHKFLDKRIDFYLSATSNEDFYDLMLQRLEEDYQKVPLILSLIALSENGMNEDELQTISGLRSVDFHLFISAFKNHRVIRSGHINFSHQYVVKAIWNRYDLNNSDKAKFYRQLIIDYFSNNDSITRERKISELAFQYYLTDNDDKLYNTVLSFEAFLNFNKTEEGNAKLARYWRRLLKNRNGKYQSRDYMDLDWTSIAIQDLPYVEIGLFIQNFLGDSNTSLKYYDTYLAMCRDSRMADISSISSAIYTNSAQSYTSQGNYQKALDYYFSALSIEEDLLGKKSNKIAILYNNIGHIYELMGNYDMALGYHFDAKDLFENYGGIDSYHTSFSYNNLGVIYAKKGLHDMAIFYLKQALRIRENTFGLNNVKTATSMNNIGAVYDNLGDYTHALDYYLNSLDIYKKICGDDHPSTATIYNNIGNVYSKQGDYNRALEYCSKSLDIEMKILGDNSTSSPHIATTYNNIGSIYLELCDYVQALNNFIRAKDIQEKVLGLAHPDTAKSYNNIGWAYYYLGDCTQALDYLNKARIFRVNKLGPNHPDTQETIKSIGYVQQHMKDSR